MVRRRSCPAGRDPGPGRRRRRWPSCRCWSRLLACARARSGPARRPAGRTAVVLRHFLGPGAVAVRVGQTHGGVPVHGPDEASGKASGSRNITASPAYRQPSSGNWALISVMAPSTTSSDRSRFLRMALLSARGARACPRRSLGLLQLLLLMLGQPLLRPGLLLHPKAFQSRVQLWDLRRARLLLRLFSGPLLLLPRLLHAHFLLLACGAVFFAM